MSDSLPPTPTDAARASLAAGAKDMAQDALMRRVRTFARGKLPRPIYDLVFRGRGVGEVAEAEARRRLRNIAWGCGFSIVFALLAGGVLLFVAVVIGWALFIA